MPYTIENEETGAISPRGVSPPIEGDPQLPDGPRSALVRRAWRDMQPWEPRVVFGPRPPLSSG